MRVKARSVFAKTLPFVWLKLFLGLATVLLSAALLAACVGIGMLFGEGGTLVGILVWLGATGIVRFIILHYFGYMTKAGHVAVISEAVTSGKVPKNQFTTAKTMVASRFAASNVYFAIDKLIDGAVKQLQNTLGRAGGVFSAVPGADMVVKAGKLFISISLGYVDECCLGYTFYKKEQNAYKSAADGVVIYAQNW